MERWSLELSLDVGTRWALFDVKNIFNVTKNGRPADKQQQRAYLGGEVVVQQNVGRLNIAVDERPLSAGVEVDHATRRAYGHLQSACPGQGRTVALEQHRQPAITRRTDSADKALYWNSEQRLQSRQSGRAEVLPGNATSRDGRITSACYDNADPVAAWNCEKRRYSTALKKKNTIY